MRESTKWKRARIKEESSDRKERQEKEENFGWKLKISIGEKFLPIGSWELYFECLSHSPILLHRPGFLAILHLPWCTIVSFFPELSRCFMEVPEHGVSWALLFSCRTQPKWEGGIWTTALRYCGGISKSMFFLFLAKTFSIFESLVLWWKVKHFLQKVDTQWTFCVESKTQFSSANCLGEIFQTSPICY